ncbi:YceD family protein [Nocardia testacea]|uniref:YceD family protein n=1 Tax=Nocardia testacea TaxID=248551 RepID=UPI003C2B1002
MPADTTARSRSGAPRAHGAGFVLDVRSLGRAPGSMRELRRTVTTTERLGLDLVGVPVGAEVELDLRLQSVSEGVLVTGSLEAPVAGECSRCLERFTDTVRLSLTELFAYPDSATDQTSSEDEVYRMSDDLIDLEPLVVDQLGLELPLQPLCSPDCQGLCPECGVRMAIAGSDHGHEILDPRWAGLAKFASGSPGSGSPDEGAATGDHPTDTARNSTEEK